MIKLFKPVSRLRVQQASHLWFNGSVSASDTETRMLRRRANNEQETMCTRAIVASLQVPPKHLLEASGKTIRCIRTPRCPNGNSKCDIFPNSSKKGYHVNHVARSF